LNDFSGNADGPMSERFFVATPITGPQAELTGDEARHLAGVMRAKVGDEVVLFDNSGAEFTARVAAIQKHAVQLAILQRHELSRELPFILTLAVALPKGDRQKWLVEKATELGVTQIVPLITERGVAQPVEAALERLRRSVIEASKQCGRNRLMDVVAAVRASEFFAAAPGSFKDGPANRLICEPCGPPLREMGFTRQDLIAAVGPEGGFSPAELAAAHSAGWQAVSLGARILRVETAAAAMAAWASIAAGDSPGEPQGVQ
jgi:16S rRNA (uracil1498-N3)-methyltransferase